MAGTFQLWCDGSAAPNPGPMGLGVVVIAPDGTESCASVLWPERGDNNVAEALAVAEAVRRAVTLGASDVVVHSDSDVVVRLLRHARAPTQVPALADRRCRSSPRRRDVVVCADHPSTQQPR